MQLTEHFSYEEMIFSQTASREGIDNEPGEDELANLTRLCGVLEEVRLLLDEHPIVVSSGYRCPELNSAIGGSDTSAHMDGLGVDFTCWGFGSPKEVCHRIEPHIGALGIDQLIYEYGDWVHIGLSTGEPRCQCLTINDSGTCEGIV